MKLAISICVLVFVCTFISAEDTEWDNFKFKLSKSFRNKGDEDSHRSNFLKRTRGFAEHNKNYEEGKVSYKLGPNQYSDLSLADVERYLCGSKIETPEQLAAAPHLIRRSTPLLKDSSEPLPDSIDWREKGVVTAVKNQGYCGSCYAFATVGILESLFCQHYKTRATSLSPQNIVDCSKNMGCEGGAVRTALEYVIEKNGINAEVTYPYAMEVKDCKFNESQAFLPITGYFQTEYQDAEDMKRAVAQNGPLAVLLSGSCDSFANYKEGVLDDDSCSKYQNHASLITGYGTSKDGKPYWIVKNSWGPTWGKEGYIKVVRGKNQCGIEDYGYQAVI